MRRRKIYPTLALATLCVLLAGCVYNTSDTVIHDDASGTVDYVDAIIMEGGEELEEGNKIYEYNGNKYQGAPQSYAFSSAEEFNKLFTVSSGDEEVSDGSISGNTIPATLSKSSDGSLTLVVGVTALETNEEEAEASAKAGSEAAGGNETLSEEDTMAIAESMMESVYMCYTFTFDRPVRQLSGDTEGVTIEGGKITINILSVQDISADLVFTTATYTAIPALSAARSGTSLTYSVTNASEGARLIAARYDGGRMTYITTVPVSGSKSSTIPMSGSGTAYKLMLVDQSFSPLCPAWRG